VAFFVFVADPKDIISWSAVHRLEETKGGIQRRTSQSKLRAVTKFFTKVSENVMPTSVILAFKPQTTIFTRFSYDPEPQCDNDSLAIEWGTLSFEFDEEANPRERPAFVVDGQHRLFGMADISKENPPILVSALLDADETEQAFQFVVINNKASKVPPDLVRSLIVDFNEDDLQGRLETARVTLRPQALLVAIVDDEMESPFYHMIDWQRRRGEGHPAVKPVAIEDSMNYIRRTFPEFDDDQDALIDFFFAMWHGVKEAYSGLWDDYQNHLFENAGFKAYTEYLTDQIDSLSNMDIAYVDTRNLDSVRETTRTISNQIVEQFWRVEWLLRSLDTSSGRDTIKEDIRIIRKNRKDGVQWYKGLQLIGSVSES
jgi:DGQHR domain-containing protein